ncbi:tRNA lysidine(34) synthetase TilS [bacterium]|nr:tRNA lysidine(34) synthetase TilS [bacterium]
MKKEPSNNFEKRFLNHCHERRFFKKRSRVLLAVSGGADSMVLAHLFLLLKSELHLGIAHLHHGLREKAADADQQFVERFATSNHLDYFTERVDALGHSKKHKTSIEESCRILRYDFLERMARQHDYDRIVTAHHAGDQAETVLLRLIKGAGWSGLAGIRESRGLYVRPLLNLSKEEIQSYAKSKRIKYRTDTTNRDTRFLRNRIRRRLMPLLKAQFDPQIEKHLRQLSIIAAHTEDWLQHDAKRLFKRVCKQSDGKITLEIDRFKRYFATQQFGVLSVIGKALSVEFDFDDIKRINDLVGRSESGKKLFFGKWTCWRLQNTLVFQSRLATSRQGQKTVTIGRTEMFNDWTCRITELLHDQLEKRKLGRDRYVEYADADAITGPIRIRFWQNGDFFYPLGMNGAKKLSDFFIDEKISVPDKQSLPILCERRNGRDRIIWICGMRLDDRFKLTPDTQRILKLECRRNEQHD